MVRQETKTTMVNKREKNETVKITPVTVPTGRTAAKPKAAARVAKTVPAAKPAKKKTAKPAAVAQEDVAFRAYLIGEKRQQFGLPGDSVSDWVEAERQLASERATHGVG